MVICFGLSWPTSIYKSCKSKTAKGKSILFLFLIGFGYVVGVVWKAIEWKETGVLKYPSIFYVINLIMISIDIAFYFRNAKYDKMKKEDK